MGEENMNGKIRKEDILFDNNDVTSSRRYLHTPSEFARKNLIYVQETGTLRSLKPHVSSRSNLESYLFFIVTDGRGQVTYGGKTYNVKTGDCAFIDCRSLYEHISSEDKPWELKWVHMDGGIVGGYYSVFCEKNGGIPVFHADDKKKYVGYLDEIAHNTNEKDMTGEYICNCILTSLVTQIIVEAIRESNKKLNPDVLLSIREAVNARFRQENLLEAICTEYNMDELTVNKQFKEKYGIELYDYILNRRFTCAKELLRFTVKPVKDIVTESGIMNADLFRHLFIENEGMTAEEYRRKWAQWNRG